MVYTMGLIMSEGQDSFLKSLGMINLNYNYFTWKHF